MYWVLPILYVIVGCVVNTRCCGMMVSRASNKFEFEPVPTDNISCLVRPDSCSDSCYRSYDGSCNNLEHGWWGTPLTPYRRLLKDNYSDGVNGFPKSVKNKELPNPREVSTKIYVDIPEVDKEHTIVFMQYGQVIAHDMSLTAGVGQTATIITCCDKGKYTSIEKSDPRCASIRIPKNDAFYIPEGRKCINFYRTESTKDRGNCTGATKVGEPLTSITSTLDISYLYGSNEETAKKVRAFEGGLLKSIFRHGKEVLPQDPNPTQACIIKTAQQPCYYTGDIRVNQNPQLALLHILYMYNHNIVARALSKINPHWSEERVFQESRKIVIAQHQHVIYYEFLPYMLGKDYMIEKKLIYPDEPKYIDDYDANINLATSNEFATAAFRFYHTEIMGTIESYPTEYRNTTNNIDIEDWFIKPEVIEYEHNLNGLTRGLGTQAQSKVDRYHTNIVLNELFRNGILGDDLKAIDVMRGRDHGLAPYYKALQEFGLSNPKSFDDFEKFIDKPNVDLLRRVYSDYRDVDLVVGLSLERLLPGTLAGPTVRHILAEQFLRTRKGDRFFYENNQHKCAFTVEQLNNIRQSSTIARFLCYNPEIEFMQPKAFELISEKNPLVPCTEIPRMNLKLWKDRPNRKKTIK